MKKSRVKYLAGRFYKKLGEYSREMALDFDKDTIHDFRVEYKKLRAFFRLVNGEAGKKKIQVAKNLKEVYSLAGSLRDQQLQQARMSEVAKEKLLHPHGNFIFFEPEITEMKSRLKELLATDPVNKCKKKTDKLLPGHCKLSSFSSYFKKKCSAVEEILLAGLLTDERIHAIRKILKDLVYNLEIYRLEDRFPPGTWKEKVADYYNPLLEEMGDYQDKCTAIALIEWYWLQHLHTEDRELAAFIKEEWEKEKTTMRQLLIRKLKADQVLATGNPAYIPLSLDIGL
jgi:CHAD domain-containing protein